MTAKRHIFSEETATDLADRIIKAVDRNTAAHGGLSEASEIEYGVRWVTGASNPVAERVIRVNGVISPWNIEFTQNIGGNITDNPFDYIDIFSPTVISDKGGNKFARFKRIYTGMQAIGIYTYNWVCLKKLYGFYNAPRWCYKNGREYWNYRDVGVYEGAEETIGGSVHLVSKTGLCPSHNRTRTNYYNYANAWNNTLGVDTSKELYTITNMSEITELLQPLMLIMLGTKNAQAIYGGANSNYVSGVAVSSYDAATNKITLSNASQISYFHVGAGFVANGEYRKVMEVGSNYFIHDGTAFTSVTSVETRPNYTGETDAIMATHGTLVNDGKRSFKLFNIENIYGNIWKNILDCSIVDNVPYMCNDIENWTEESAPEASNKFTKLGYKCAAANGYVTEMGYDTARPDCVLPVAVGGSTSTYYCDYYWQNTGKRTVFYGGYLDYGSHVGAGCWGLGGALGASYWDIGARLFSLKILIILIAHSIPAPRQKYYPAKVG